MFEVVQMDMLDRAFQRARSDLGALGLLRPGRYLDTIECERSAWPSGWWRELGYVYDSGVDWFRAMVGYRAGVIYVPINAPVQAYVPGGTLLDTLRHEYAHAWAWLDTRFVDGRWFRDAFGASYYADWPGGRKPAFRARDFVSEYACELPREDFAETFMYAVKYRASMERFRGRPGLYRKLLAVRRAIQIAADERVGALRVGARV